jgi:hypothetical protein
MVLHHLYLITKVSQRYPTGSPIHNLMHCLTTAAYCLNTQQEYRNYKGVQLCRLMRAYALLTVSNGTTPQYLHYPYFRHESRYTSIDLHVPLKAGRFLGPEQPRSVACL